MVRSVWVDLVTHAQPISQFVLVILLLFSAVSWGIILYKFWQFGRSARQSSTFLQIFRKSTKFSEVQAVCPTLTESPLAPTKELHAHCTDCHAEDGRDLKYFNYSNLSIIERAKFHGMTAEDGRDIAGYIRGLATPAPGRP